MDNQQGPTVQHMELCSVLCGSLDGRGVWGTRDTCTCRLTPFTVYLKLSQHCESAILQYKMKKIKQVIFH